MKAHNKLLGKMGVGVLVAVSVMTGLGPRVAGDCTQLVPYCDHMASHIDDSGVNCPSGYRGECSLLVCDQLVGCASANAQCSKDGTVLYNVNCALYIGNCDGHGDCGAAFYSSGTSDRCEKQTGDPCLEVNNQQINKHKYLAKL